MDEDSHRRRKPHASGEIELNSTTEFTQHMMRLFNGQDNYELGPTNDQTDYTSLNDSTEQFTARHPDIKSELTNSAAWYRPRINTTASAQKLTGRLSSPTSTQLRDLLGIRDLAQI